MSAFEEGDHGEEEDAETPEAALFEAIHRNDLDAASTLIAHRQVDVNRVNARHKTMLGLAVEQEHVPMVRMLIDHGADVNGASFCSADYSFETPVVTAARLQHEELIDLFVKKDCSVDAVAGGGAAGDSSSRRSVKSAIQWAATYGNLGMLQLLYEAGGDIDWVGPFFHTALHYATLANKPDAVEWLLEKKAEVNLNGEGRSPLHIACVKGFFDIVGHLLTFGCAVDNYDTFGFTPFSLACLRGHLDIVKYMRKHAPADTTFNIEDGLHRAAECGHLDLLEYLIREGADVNSLNTVGESALSIAARGQPKSVELLLANQAIISVVDKRGYSPLQHAILREQHDIAVTLVKHGHVLQSACASIDSPLQSSYSISDPALLKYLVDAGVPHSSEGWFNSEAIDTKLRELDFQYNSLRYRKSIERQRELWHWLRGKLGQPRSLLEASRIVVRAQLVEATGGRSIAQPITQLPLPKAMIRYLSLDEMFWI